MDTLFKGRCYLLQGGNESKTYWHLDLPTNDSIANIYVMPENSENALILGIWHYPIKMMSVGKYMYQSVVIRKEFHVRRSAPGSTCTTEPEDRFYQVTLIHYHHLWVNDNSSIQCEGNVIAKDYMDFPKATCPGVSEPCWIPQIQSILPTSIISRLPQCDSMEKYKCMLLTVMYSRKNVKRRCKKSCKAENYKIISRTGTIEPFTKVCSFSR